LAVSLAARAAIDAASDTAYALLQLNAHRGDELARDIEATRKRAEIAAFSLDGLSALLCCLAAFLAWRTVRLSMEAQAAQQRLLEARATELEAFSSRVAHDILNPLGAAALGLSLLRRTGANPEVLGRAQRALGRAAQLVDGLLRFARAGAQPEPGASCEVRPALQDALAAVAERAAEGHVVVEAEHAPACEVACHPGVLASLLTNLVGNAIKYMGDAPERRVRVRVHPGERTVRFEVEDTGPGIPAEAAERIFEPYVRASTHGEPGIGLGLATVKKLCAAHGGAVGLQSVVGHGSLFWFELPSPWETRAGALPASPEATRH
jgi:signal transduction histidine kinase